jgi:hypothetical protein
VVPAEVLLQQRDGLLVIALRPPQSGEVEPGGAGQTAVANRGGCGDCVQE